MRLHKVPKLASVFYSKRIWGFSLNKNAVYLTFDDGPHPEITPFVLDELKKRNIRATFFCVGNNVKQYPELFQRIKEEGHQIGNHTMRHENASKTNAENYFKSIEEANSLIQSDLFRPPYGRLSPRLAKEISKKYKIIMWSWLSYDFDPKICVTRILWKANKQIKAGDILVLHDNPKIIEKQKELLPKLLDVIQRKKLNCELISY